MKKCISCGDPAMSDRLIDARGFKPEAGIDPHDFCESCYAPVRREIPDVVKKRLPAAGSGGLIYPQRIGKTRTDS